MQAIFTLILKKINIFGKSSYSNLNLINIIKIY